MTISLRLNDADTMLFKKYAELNGITISELVRQSVIERIEEEYDLKAYEKAMVEYKTNRSGQWRYRVGDYRIIAEIQDEKIIVLVIGIGHKKEIY